MLLDFLPQIPPAILLRRGDTHHPVAEIKETSLLPRTEPTWLGQNLEVFVGDRKDINKSDRRCWLQDFERQSFGAILKSDKPRL